MAGSLGSLVVSLTAETAQFTASLDRASYTAQKNFQNISSFAKTAAGSIAALYGASSLVGFIKDQIDAADAAGKMAQKVGISVEELSKLQYAAKLADVDTQQLQTGLVKLSKGMVEAANGTGQARNALSAMGISVKNNDGTLKASSTVLGEVADKFATYGDSANKTALAVQIFGKSGAELIPLLNAGSAGIKEAGDELERFGAVISEKAAKNAELFNDNLTRLSTVGSAFGKSIANEILPSLNNLAEEFLVARANGIGFFDMLQMGLRSTDLKKQLNEVNEEITSLRESKGTSILPDFFTKYNEESLIRQKTTLEQLISARDKMLNPPPATEQKKTTAPFSVDLEKAAREAEKAAKEAERLAERYADGLASAQEANSKFGTSLSEMAQKAQLDIAGMFMTDAQKKQQQDLISINKQFLDTQASISKQYTEGKLTLEAYNEQMALLGGNYDFGISQSQALFEQQEKLNGSYEYGATTALAKYTMESQNLANTANTFVTNSLRSVEDSLVGVIGGSMSAAQAFKNMANSIINDLIRIFVRQQLTNLMGNIFFPTTPSISGGGRALGGDVTGGTSYLVGERGAEIFTPSTSGVITPNASVGGSVGGNQTVVNQTFQISTGVSQTVRTEIQSMMPRIMEATKNAVADSKRRGGSFGSMMS